MRTTIRLATAIALSILPTMHRAQADTVIDTRPVPMGTILEIHPDYGTAYQLRWLRAPRMWRTAGPMAKRHWRTEQRPMSCPAPIRRCTTDADCERKNPCVPPQHRAPADL